MLGKGGPASSGTDAVAGLGLPGGPRAVYDFLANRPLAVVAEEGALIIETAAPEVWKFMDGGWKAALLAGERDQGDRLVALADGVSAMLRFPGDGIASAAARDEILLWLRPAPDVPAQAATVLLNERVVANLSLAPAYRCYRVVLGGAGRVLPGENLLRLHFRAAGTLLGHRSAAAIERVAIGPAGKVPRPCGAEAQPFARPGRVRSFGIGGDARPALAANTATRWSYYLVPPEPGAPGAGLHLSFSYGVQTAAAPALFGVSAQRDGAPAAPLWSGQGQPGQWRDADVDLGRLLAAGDPGRALRLDLSISGPGAISAPRLVDPAASSGPATPSLARVPESPPRPEHVLLVVVDALRADRPLPSLAARPGVSLVAAAQGNYPLPSHASLLSATYPSVHRLLREGGTLPASLPLLPEVLHRAGFATGLFSATGYVSERFGLRRGFDAYRNLVREGQRNPSLEVWKAALPWLEAQLRAGHRTFLYLATADPHAPYTPPPDLLARTWDRPYAGPLRGAVSAEQLLRLKREKLRLQPADRAYLAALYDAEVLETDATLERILADLARLHILDRTALLIVGSHGEELFDHGSVGHGHSVYEELAAVPLFLSFPPRLAGHRTLGLLAEQVDVAPTLLHLCGAAVPETMQGESLLPLLVPAGDNRAPGPRMPRSGQSQHDQQLRGLRLGRYKLISAGGDRLQLYDLGSDPHERRDRAADQPIALRALRNAFSLGYAYQRRWNKQRLGDPANLSPEFAMEIGP